MQAADIRLGKILANSQVFIVPHFQRPYVWDQEENWEPLWLDIRTAAEGVESEQEASHHEQDPQTYFLGAVVTQERWRQPQRLASANVIDGQQRLTTVLVLIAAARAVALRLGLAANAGRFEGLIENNEKVVHEKFPQDRQKLTPLPQDREAFEWALQANPHELPSEEHKLVAARRWFEEQIADWATSDGDPADRLSHLQFALEERIQLVHIALDTRDDPQVIYEALNHRGVPLNAADLIKNLLFQTVEAQGDHARADDLLTKGWLPFDSPRWREEFTRGRTTRTRVDAFIAHWLTMKTGAEVSVEHLFVTFKKWLLSSGENAGEVILELKRYGNVYLNLGRLPVTTATGRLLDSMVATQTTTPWPLLLHLHGGACPPEQQEIGAAAIDSFLMRRAVCGMTTKDYNRLFLSVLATAQEADPDVVGTVVRDLLADQTADSRLWPSDSQFLRGLLAPDLFHRAARGRLRSLLVGLDNHLTTGKSEAAPTRHATDTTLTIEHLMPQKWRAHWALPDPTLEAEAARADAVHRLGNLTLLTKKLNPSVSNRAWAIKREEIKKHSLLRLTTSSVLSRPSDIATDMTEGEWAADWDESRIRLRGLWLAQLALQVWPRPEGGFEEEWEDALEVRQPTRGSSGRTTYAVSLRNLITAGLLHEGDQLEWSRPRSGVTHHCHVLSDGRLRTPDGTVVSALSTAAKVVSAGATVDGWSAWRLSRRNLSLAQLREQYLEGRAERSGP